MIGNLVEIPKEHLIAEAQNMKYDNYRFVTATCVDTGDGYLDVLYHFGKDYELASYRVRVRKDEEIPSISGVYFCAMLVENEMKELFGLKVKGLVVDYGGHLLLSEGAPEVPMAKQRVHSGGAPEPPVPEQQIIIERKEEK